VRARGYILHFAHSRQPFALFDYLVNSAVITTRDDRDSGPTWIQTLTHRDRLDIETSRTEQPDDPR
jgi:predicted ATPase